MTGSCQSRGSSPWTRARLPKRASLHTRLTSASDICNLLTQPYLRTCAPLLGEFVTAVLVVLLEAPEFLTLALSRVTGLRIWRSSNSSSVWKVPTPAACHPILVSASFGLTVPLLRFWTRQGFLVAEMSPLPNLQTGERSVVMVRPLASASTAFKEAMLRLGPEFGKRFFRLRLRRS